MNWSTRKLLVIITESVLEGVLIETIERLGGRGYTITDARGKGTRGVRNSAWKVSGNIRIEVVCDTAIANTIAAHLQENYYNDYAMIVLLLDAAVMRPERF